MDRHSTTIGVTQRNGRRTLLRVDVVVIALGLLGPAVLRAPLDQWAGIFATAYLAVRSIQFVAQLYLHRFGTRNAERTSGLPRACVDQADKSWLVDEARRSDEDAMRRMEGLSIWIVVGGAGMGLALYDWTQGMEWAHALVALVYQVGPL